MERRLIRPHGLGGDGDKGYCASEDYSRAQAAELITGAAGLFIVVAELGLKGGEIEHMENLRETLFGVGKVSGVEQKIVIKDVFRIGLLLRQGQSPRISKV